MKSFTDAQNRVWDIQLTIGCLRRVKSEVEVDLLVPEAMVDESGKPDPKQQMTLAQRLATDVMLFVDVLYGSLKLKADELNVTVYDFCEAIPPAACRAAREAFLSEWEAFFLSLGRDDQAAVIRAAIDLVDEHSQLKKVATENLLAAAKPQMRLEIDKLVSEAMAQLTAGN